MYKIYLKTGQIHWHKQTFLFGNLYSCLNNFHIEYRKSQQQPLPKKKKKKKKEEKKKKIISNKVYRKSQHITNILSKEQDKRTNRASLWKEWHYLYYKELFSDKKQ